MKSLITSAYQCENVAWEALLRVREQNLFFSVAGLFCLINGRRVISGATVPENSAVGICCCVIDVCFRSGLNIVDNKSN